jgi:hypothetical protein
MQILPSAPTDNIFKFMAITGAWLVASYLFLLVFMVYVSDRESDSSRHRTNIEFAQSLVRKIDLRLRSLEKKQFYENKIPDLIPGQLMPAEEIEYLTTVKGRWNHYVKQHEYNESNRQLSNAYQFLFYNKYMAIGVTSTLVVSLSLLLFGLLGWWNDQKKQDEIQAIELDTKKVQLAQLRRIQGYKDPRLKR